MQNITDLDLSNLLCPMPVIRTQNALKNMQQGDFLKIICTDPGVKHDIPAWCKINGYDIVETQEQDYSYIFIIKA